MFSCILIVLALLAFISKPVQGQYTATIFAGTGTQGNSGDNGPAAFANLNQISGTWVDSNGVTFFADGGASVIRRVDTNGIITTIGGTGTSSKSNAGGAFTSVALYKPWGIAGDSTFLYISDNYHIWKYERASGIVSILAGTGTEGTAGNGGPATSAQVNQPSGLWLNSDNSLYISEYGSHLVRKIDLSTNIISTVAGGGGYGFNGDGGPAASTNTQLSYPRGVYIDTNGVIFIADFSNYRIRYIVNGIINTYAGGGPYSNTADGFVGTNAFFSLPTDVKGDTMGNIYLVETSEVKVVDYAMKAVITFVTGLNTPRGIWLDKLNSRTVPTAQPSESPTIKTQVPSESPTHAPTSSPTRSSSEIPTTVPSFYPTLNPTRVNPTLTPSASPSSEPTVKNDDVVQVSVTSRVKFVNGQTFNQVSLETLVSAFQNISDNAQSTAITSTVLVGQSSPQSVRRGLIARVSMSVSGQPSYIYDIGFLSSYEMSYHAGYTSSELAVLKTTKVRQAIEVGEFESVLRNLAVVRNATQLLNASSSE
eukprot:gene12343-biopygen2622